ncbi:galactose-1-phosphate uridyl transferase, partial [Nowakowskiella sp. JEL0078]
PGNTRASGGENPRYPKTFVFDNDFPAVRMDQPELISGQYHVQKDPKHAALYRVESVRGTCKVMCFSPKHNLTLAEMEVNEIIDVIEGWCGQIIIL